MAPRGGRRSHAVGFPGAGRGNTLCPTPPRYERPMSETEFLTQGPVCDGGRGATSSTRMGPGGRPCGPLSSTLGPVGEQVPTGASAGVTQVVGLTVRFVSRVCGPHTSSAQFPRGRPNSWAPGDILRARKTQGLLRGVTAGAEDSLELWPLTGAPATFLLSGGWA